MKLDFSRKALVETLLHLAIAAAASSISWNTLPAIQSDTPRNSVQALV